MYYNYKFMSIKIIYVFNTLLQPTVCSDYNFLFKRTIIFLLFVVCMYYIPVYKQNITHQVLYTAAHKCILVLSKNSNVIQIASLLFTFQIPRQNRNYEQKTENCDVPI